MRRITLYGLLAMAVCGHAVVANITNAQDGRSQQQDLSERGRNRGQRGGPEGRGAFGGPMAQFGILGLLRIEEVQQELNLTEDQLVAIPKLVEEANVGRPDPPRDFSELTEGQRDTFRKEMEDWRAKHSESAKTALQALLEADQYERLMQIAIQQQGPSALRDQDVATKLNLTEEQRAKINEMLEAGLATLQSEMRSAFAAGPGGNREAMREKIGQLRTKMDEEVLNVLTSEQREKFQAMKGEEIDLPRPGPGRRGDGGPRPRLNQNTSNK